MEKNINRHKISVFLMSIAACLTLSACDSQLKEHPLPPELKKQLDMKNNPALQAKAVSGSIAVAPELANNVPENATLFVFARAKGTQGGPPLAVKRLSGIRFPYAYQIGPWDVMVPGTSFDGELTVSARLDQDGNATASPGDIEGSRDAMAGDKHVDVVLDRFLDDKKPAPPGASAPTQPSGEAPGRSPAGGTPVTGSITVDPNLAKKVPENAALFIFARVKGVQGGPPLAVKRLSGIRFPYEYTIGPADVMMPGARFEGELTITARLDQDGNAAASPGDIEGSREAAPGQEKADIVLDRVLDG
ncbi:MAG: hypothetical protein HY579_12285 [Nitrospinae bacterium]|nr:hypothetical protein [Nitrospinota bacterium]